MDCVSIALEVGIAVCIGFAAGFAKPSYPVDSAGQPTAPSYLWSREREASDVMLPLFIAALYVLPPVQRLGQRIITNYAVLALGSFKPSFLPGLASAAATRDARAGDNDDTTALWRSKTTTPALASPSISKLFQHQLP